MKGKYDQMLTPLWSRKKTRGDGVALCGVRSQWIGGRRAGGDGVRWG